ncbi:MAG: hypothetical protein ABF673_11905, partial [Acetobacter persici]
MSRRSVLALALLAGSVWNAGGADAAPLDAAGAAQQIRALLAMPFATDLVGASATPRFAWVEKRDGVRN